MSGRIPRASRAAKLLALLAAAATLAGPRAGEPFPGAKPLATTADLSEQMVSGIRQFLLKETTSAAASRSTYWKRDLSDRAAYEISIQPNRNRLRALIGAVDPRVPVEELDLLDTSALGSVIATGPGYTIAAVRWPVFEGVHAEGLWVRQNEAPSLRVVAIPDADQTPEMACGLIPGVRAEDQFVRRLAESGAEVLVFTLLSRSDEFSGNPAIGRFTNQPHREWIYRQAYELGRTPIGYEVQKAEAAVEWLHQKNLAERSNLPLAVVGHGEGGLVALHTSALNTNVAAALVSGSFKRREALWREPIYRNVFGLLREFGDAEIATLVAPRPLVVVYSEEPEVKGPPPARQGRSGAAPGALATPERYDAEEELFRAIELMRKGRFNSDFRFVHGNEGKPVGAGSHLAVGELFDALKLPRKIGAAWAEPPVSTGRLPDPAARQKRVVRELTDHTQAILRASQRHRDQTFWNNIQARSPEAWAVENAAWKKRFWEETLGKFDNKPLPPNARMRKLFDTPTHTAYDVVLDVWPEVIAWGVLLWPNDLRDGEKRPVVVTQHGLEGVPLDTIQGADVNSGHQFYKAFSTKLAEKGYIVFAPHNPYRGGDNFRVIQRLSNPLGRCLFSVILGQHQQILSWLKALPNVDPARVGFYGLSYGGKTAMRVPSLLDDYALSICSADFNEWVVKCSTVDSPYSYMYTGEYDMPEWNLGHTFNYAEMAALVAPRPFMVERGHGDGVAPDEWVAHEYARVRRFYARLGIPDSTAIEFFNGPHTINGVGTYQFLDRFLKPPAK